MTTVLKRIAILCGARSGRGASREPSAFLLSRTINEAQHYEDIYYLRPRRMAAGGEPRLHERPGRLAVVSHARVLRGRARPARRRTPSVSLHRRDHWPGSRTSRRPIAGPPPGIMYRPSPPTCAEAEQGADYSPPSRAALAQRWRAALDLGSYLRFEVAPHGQE